MTTVLLRYLPTGHMPCLFTASGVRFYRMKDGTEWIGETDEPRASALIKMNGFVRQYGAGPLRRLKSKLTLVTVARLGKHCDPPWVDGVWFHPADISDENGLWLGDTDEAMAARLVQRPGFSRYLEGPEPTQETGSSESTLTVPTSAPPFEAIEKCDCASPRCGSGAESHPPKKQSMDDPPYSEEARRMKERVTGVTMARRGKPCDPPSVHGAWFHPVDASDVDGLWSGVVDEAVAALLERIPGFFRYTEGPKTSMECGHSEPAGTEVDSAPPAEAVEKVDRFNWGGASGEEPLHTEQRSLEDSASSEEAILRGDQLAPRSHSQTEPLQPGKRSDEGSASSDEAVPSPMSFVTIGGPGNGLRLRWDWGVLAPHLSGAWRAGSELSGLLQVLGPEFCREGKGAPAGGPEALERGIAELVKAGKGLSLDLTRLNQWQASLWGVDGTNLKRAQSDGMHLREGLEVPVQGLIDWLNGPSQKLDALVRAGLASYGILILAPFGAGSARLAQAVSAWVLAQEEGSRIGSGPWLPAQGELKVSQILEQEVEVTAWLSGFLDQLAASWRAEVEDRVAPEIRFRLWFLAAGVTPRQRQVIQVLEEEGPEERMTTRRYSALTGCSRVTAYRDIAGLVALKCLVPLGLKGRVAAYAFHWEEDSGQLV